MVRVREKHLRELCNTMFKAADVPESEAKIVSEILVDTSIHGVDSHGVSSILGGLRALPDYITRIKNKKFVPNAPIKILVDTPTTAMWDAGLGFGFVAGAKAMKAAIKKAKKYKMGSVGIMGSGAIGGLWWYSYQAAKNNMIGLTLCRGGLHEVAPYGGLEGRLGTNPLCVAIPAGPKYKPIILDMATTGVAMGHLQVMGIRGQKVPEGWLIKHDGTWSTDPTSISRKESVLVAFGHPNSEYKGYGLSVVIEALAGAIGCGCCLGLGEKVFGHLFMAIDPTGFCSLEEFTGRIESMILDLKSSKLRPGFKEILYPGEPEWREEESRRKLGIFVDEPWWNELVKIAKDLGVDVDGIMKGGIVEP